MKKYVIFLAFYFVFCFFQKSAFAQNVEEFTLHKGQSMFISVKHLQNKEPLTSENEAIVSMSNGIITAISEGETLCKSESLDSCGNKIEKFYKIKVLPPKLMKYAFSEPNSPKCGETLTISAITDASVEQVKFLINTKNGVLRKTSEQKLPDGKNVIHKVRLKLGDAGGCKINFQAKVGDKWQNIDGCFYLSVSKNLANKVTFLGASDKCVEYIMAKEGFKSALSVDCCVKNIYDIGYGNVVNPGTAFFNNITRTEAKALLLQKLNNGIYLKALNDFIAKNNLKFSQNQFDALLSFTYNLGPSWLTDSDLRKIILNVKNTDSKNNKSAVRSIGTVISDNGLRLRSRPNTESAILAVLKFNERVDVLNEADNGWYKVKTAKGQEGFCFAQFLSVKNEYTNSNIMIVDSDEGLRLRSRPSTDSRVLTVLKFNEQIDVIDKKYNNWYKVKTKDGQEGFCFAEFLTIKPIDVESLIDKSEFSNEFLAYHNVGGKFVRGLLNRRIEELQMFFFNDYSLDGAKNKYNFSLPSCS